MANRSELIEEVNRENSIENRRKVFRNYQGIWIGNSGRKLRFYFFDPSQEHTFEFPIDSTIFAVLYCNPSRKQNSSAPDTMAKSERHYYPIADPSRCDYLSIDVAVW